MTTLLAYHGNQAIKDKYIARVKAHREADELIQGKGWDGHKGCAVGCTLENYNHSRYPIELGVPVVLAQLEDRIFEGLPQKDAMGWPERFLTAIKPGSDLEMVWPKFSLWVLNGLLELKTFHDGKHPKCKAAIGTVRGLYEEWIVTRIKPASSRFSKARMAAAAADAAAAAAYAAYAAAADAAAAAADADAADADAADAAAYAADADAADAADAAAYAARIKFWQEAANELERLLINA